ncbi:MAG: HD domain-containing protein [Planctomycetes bacterium]|nr:HD domain-containing protein [Planctomycetota bacterium]
MDTIGEKLSLSQLQQLKQFGEMINELGANFAICNAAGEILLRCEKSGFGSDENLIIANCLESIQKYSVNKMQSGSGLLISDNRFLSAVIKPENDTSAVAAIVDMGENKISSDKIENTIPAKMLVILAEKLQIAAQSEKQFEMIGTELSQVYEELVLLHKLSTNMKVTETDANFLQMACDSLTDIVLVEGIAILLEKNIDGEKRLVLTAGSGLIDINEQAVATLHDRLLDEINSGKEALLDSEVDSPFKYRWPEEIKNIIAVPLCGREKASADGEWGNHNEDSVIGLMVAVNRIDKPDFDSTDVKLFNSVANSCAVFVENGRLFGDLKDLFIGSLKALTNSIDAKDKYTRGHSERVAFISKWIAEKLDLSEEKIHKIYLAGLLHDIGKIGISGVVLRKDGKLTEQELACIRTHPSIGASILGDIKQMKDVVPGVLCHHERIDGKGYPNNLCGEQIPLIGRIVGLADSFDAMTSKRTYRNAMTVEKALEQVQKGLGTQFDEKIGKIFMASDVYRLWDMMQDGFGGAYQASSFSNYGTVAVGTLIR